MSRREICLIVLIMVGITLIGFLFGRVILPRIIMWSIGSKIESSDVPYVLEVTGCSSGGIGDFELGGVLLEGREDGGFAERSIEGVDLLTASGSLEDAHSASRHREYIAEPDRLVIDVDVSTQTVKVFMDGELIREMVASTGMEGHETPLGTFEIQNRGLWFFNEKYGQGAKYWVSFKDWGIYLFHSLAMDENKEIIQEEAEKLGEPASHGCIRLNVEDAKWIYENIPEKTKVFIHD